MAPQTTTYACFPCHKHRSQLRSHPPPQSPSTLTCPTCHNPMLHIGWRLRIPRKDDHDAWHRLWLQYISPGYGPKGLRGVDGDNRHFETCKARTRPVLVDKVDTGCERCDGVWGRMLERERERWWRRRVGVVWSRRG